jgi:hypothetical protein
MVLGFEPVAMASVFHFGKAEIKVERSVGKILYWVESQNLRTKPRQGLFGPGLSHCWRFFWKKFKKPPD